MVVPAGSDLGQVRTRAHLQPDGSLRVTGSKIFISGADHDLTDNIVHLVLCRLPDAPPGSKGLSLALVPKFLHDGTRNGIHVDALEHKMGCHGSATCERQNEGDTRRPDEHDAVHRLSPFGTGPVGPRRLDG